MNKTIGYARVSSTDQNLTIQREALGRAGCTLVLEERITGTRRDGREQLDLALKILSPGDVLVVTRLDRLGRSMRDLANIAHELQEKGASLRVTEQQIDTSTSMGRAVYGMLATFAEFETDIRRERQMEGIAKAKAAGKYQGRPKSIDRSAVLALKREGWTPTQIARKLEIDRVSVYRIMKEQAHA